MKLSYQVATKDVKNIHTVTAFQGDFTLSVEKLAKIGYRGIELMTINPFELNWLELKEIIEAHNVSVTMICSGEVFGQLGLSLTDADFVKRNLALSKMKELIDFASFFKVPVNIGRVRGSLNPEDKQDPSYHYAVSGLQALCAYAEKLNVDVVLETVTCLQTNFINTFAEGNQLRRDVGYRNFKLMADLFHMNIEEKDVIKTLDDYRDSLAYVHLSDNNRQYPGNSHLDFEKIIKKLSMIDYQGPIAIEVFQKPDQDTAARKAYEHINPLIERFYN